MAVVKLPRLPANQRLVNSDGTPTVVFSQWWQNVVKQLETTLNAILAIPEIQAALSTLDTAVAAAQTAADAAQTAATNANNAAGASDAATALANSYPSGLTISAADAGSNVTITISAHTRVYPYASGNVSVSVSGGMITAQPYSTALYLYYHDASRTGGSVTFLASTNPNAVAQVGDVHSLGAVTTPAAAGSPASGKVLRPRGYVEP